VARSEICDETKTEVFAGFEGGSLNNGPGVVAISMGRCHSTKIALMFAQPIFQHLCTELGEVPETRVTRVRSTALWEGRCARFPAGKSALNLLKTTQTMVLQDGPNGRVLQQQLKFTKATSTGQVYIDAWG